MKILQQLKENHYTESEQQVIDYLLDHLEDLHRHRPVGGGGDRRPAV